LVGLALGHEVRDGKLHTVPHDIEDFIEVVVCHGVEVAGLQPLAEIAAGKCNKMQQNRACSAHGSS
jgi:hypothetical protein